MQLSKFSDYALRVLIHLAVAEGTRCSTRDIAELQGVSFHHLAKVSQWLVAEGYAKAVRGRGGGLTLGLPAAEIRIGTLLRRSDSEAGLVECMSPGGGGCVLTPACGLKPILAEAQDAFFATLDNYTLNDVVCRKPGLANLVRALPRGTDAPI